MPDTDGNHRRTDDEDRLTAEVEALRKDNDELRRANGDLLASRQQIEANVTTRVKLPPKRADAPAVDDVFDV